MGFDRLSNFIIRNLNYNYNFIIDDIKRKFLGNHILFDLNFLIYNQMFLLEEEINTIIKIVLNLPFSYTLENKTQEKLEKIFELPWWKTHCENIEFIFDGDVEDEILNKLINFINTKQDGLSKLDLMIIDRVIDTIDNIVKDYHIKKNIQTIGIFIDGIPSFSKIIEQRKRRTKNYYEALLRKEKFDIYFKNIKNNYIEEDGIKYNYFKWVEKRFSLDKSFSPISPIIKKLEEKILFYFEQSYPSLDIFMNNGSINGESDLKIFQFIQTHNLKGDIAIHTTDSDLIHLMLVQQTYYLLKREDINISIIKHNSRDEETINYYDGLGMINCILKLYNDSTKNDKTDYLLIYDICLLLFLFGNDHLPSSIQFGSELTIDYMFHILNKNKEHIISLVDDNIKVNIDILKNTIINFNKNIDGHSAKILITRKFKMAPSITNILTEADKLNLDYEGILEFIKHVLIHDGIKLKDKLDTSDIRYILLKANPNYNCDEYINKFTEQQKNMIKNISEQILDSLDFNNLENIGLMSYVKPYIKTKDNYQDLYNILSETTLTELNTKNKVLYEPSKNDYLLLLKSDYNYDICYSYIKKVYHLTTSFFGNLINYHTNNITAFSYNDVPLFSHLIKYLEENDDSSKWINEIKEENLNESDYFNSVNHHVYITPYLSLDNIKDESIKQTAKTLDIPDLWIGNKNVDNFEHNKVKAKDFLSEWETSTVNSEAPMIINPTDFNLI